MQRYRSQLDEQPPNARDAMQRIVLALPPTGSLNSEAHQLVQLLRPAILAFAQAADIESERVQSSAPTGSPPPFLWLREPCNIGPSALQRVLKDRFRRYEAVVLPGDTSIQAMQIAAEVESHTGRRTPSVFFEPISGCGRELGPYAMRLGTDIVLERSARAVREGRIHGLICAVEDVGALREQRWCPLFPAIDHVRILVDGACLNPDVRRPMGYVRIGTYHDAMAAGADAVLVNEDVWSVSDPFEAFLAVAQQIAEGRAKFRLAR